MERRREKGKMELEKIRDELNEMMGNENRRKVYWENVLKFLNSKMSKKDFDAFIHHNLNQSLIDKHNLFVKLLLHFSSYSKSDSNSFVSFEQFCFDKPSMITQVKAKTLRQGFGTLIAPSMIDYHLFSIEKPKFGYTGKLYGSNISMTRNCLPETKTITEKLKLFVIPKAEHNNPNASQIYSQVLSTMANYLMYAVEIYLKNVISGAIRSKSFRKCVMKKHDHELVAKETEELRSYPNKKGIVFLNRIPKDSWHDHMFYKHIVEDMVDEGEEEMNSREDIQINSIDLILAIKSGLIILPNQSKFLTKLLSNNWDLL